MPGITLAAFNDNDHYSSLWHLYTTVMISVALDELSTQHCWVDRNVPNPLFVI